MRDQTTVKRLRMYAVGFMLVLVGMVIGTVVSAQDGGLITTTNQSAIVRSGPDTTFEQITVLRGGTAVAIDGRNENGNWVRMISSRGVVGWISSGTVNITLGQINGLFVKEVGSAFTLPAPPPSASTPQASASGLEGGIVVSATANVNIRTGPARGFRRIGGVNGGESFAVDGKGFGGFWVRGINVRGIVGWVSARYLTISADQINTLPIVDENTPFALGAPAGGAVAGGTLPQAVDLPGAVTSTAPVTGFSYGGHVSNLNDVSANAMYVAGMTWVKYQIRYVDGSSPDGWAGLINDTRNRGFRVLLGVVGGSPTDVNGGAGYDQRYAGYVAGLAALGADAIEIWNEPNLDREWVAPVDPARYTQLLAASYNAIKSVNPNTLVISGAPAPTGAEAAFPGGQVMNDDRFIAGMAAAGAARYMDCVGVHYNEGIVPPNWTTGDPRDDYYTRYLRGMMDVYWNAFGGSRPLCFTELGYLSPEGFGPLPGFFAWAQDTTVAEQAAWLDGAVSIARNSGRVRLLIVWNVDFTGFGADPVGGYAMIRPGGGCPACEALGN